MSESNQTPETTTSAPVAAEQPVVNAAQPTTKKGYGGWWVALVLLLAIGAAGWLGYAKWWPHRQQQLAAMTAQQQQTAASMSQFEQQLSALEGRIAQQVNQSTAALEQAVRNQLRQQQQQLDNYHMAVKSVQAELANLDLSQEAHWRIFEARNLTDRAAMKLWIEHDIAAAIAFLKLALSHLTALDNPAHFAVREALVSDIARLEQLPQQQVSAASLALIGIRAQLAEQDWQQSVTQPNAGTDPSSDNTWLSNLQRSMATLFSQFIQVQRHDQAVAPMLEQAYFNVLQQRVLLQLQLAQQAALHNSQALYEANLDEAIHLLQHVASVINNTDLAASIGQLQQLRQQQLRPAYPAQLEAQGQLERLAQQLGQGG